MATRNSAFKNKPQKKNQKKPPAFSDEYLEELSQSLKITNEQKESILLKWRKTNHYDYEFDENPQVNKSKQVSGDELDEDEKSNQSSDDDSEPDHHPGNMDEYMCVW